MFTIHAPAKVNLYLHVGPVRSDGRHPLDSLVVFADSRAADIIRFAPDTTGQLRFSGQTRQDFDLSSASENLVVRAVRALEQATGRVISGKISLEKHLPIAAGIGGGSADAAATLHLMNGALQFGLSQAELMDIAIPLGGDVPACVAGRPVLMRGDGDRVEPYTEDLPELPALIVWPGRACPTGPVFRAFDEAQSGRDFREAAPPVGSDVEAFSEALGTYRNDLAPPAMSMIPEIAATLQLLRQSPHVLFAAMSGSGATCFALFESPDVIEPVCARIRDQMPDAWMFVTRLGNAGFDPVGFSL